MELSNSAWSRLSNGEDVGFHWYDDDEIWAASFWDTYDVREQECAQQEHLDRLTALLGDAEAAESAWSRLGVGLESAWSRGNEVFGLSQEP
jgi:hypothetical protein